MEPRRLTSFSHGAGCGCKLGPDQLRGVLAGLDLPVPGGDVLVGADTGDDAAVVRLADGTAIIATLDYFTPIVDDPFDWGRIAATNALSDVYAMGGTPLLALNVVNWPVDDLPLEMLGRVLAGGAAVAADAGIPVLGGHSITDPEPKYGMVAIGLVDPERLLRNSTARPGLTLVLTKPLGLGIISTAIKRGVASPDLIGRAVEVMTRLNAGAAAAARDSGAAAATDVTGFGLLGHLHRMLASSGCAATIEAASVPFIDGVAELARGGVVPGGTMRNLTHVEPHVDLGGCDGAERAMLADAQTSGGLLVAVEDADAMLAAASVHGIDAWVVGRTHVGEPGSIRIEGRPSVG